MSKSYFLEMNGDETLIKGCIDHARASQQALYARYSRKMLVVCMRYARNAEDAQDILQEGFIKVFSNIHLFKGESKLETWMTRIFINTALNHQRQKLFLFPMTDVQESAAQTESIALHEFSMEELLKVIQSLPDGCRVVFNLFAIEGYPHKEIAAMLGISEGTAKSQYNRARVLLKARLQEYSLSYGKFGKTRF